jgi:hypothetical protein
MQELYKLRAENEELIRKIDATSMESLDALESQLADQKCINSSLQVEQFKILNNLLLFLKFMYIFIHIYLILFSPCFIGEMDDF